MFYLALGYSDTYMPFLTLIAFHFFRRQIRKEESGFIYFITINFLIFAATNVLFFFSINNLLLYHFYYLFELVFVTGYITKQLLRIPHFLFYAIVTLYTFFWASAFFSPGPLELFNNYAAILEKAVIMLICIYYIIICLRKGAGLRQSVYNPGFFIAAGFLLSSAFGLISVSAYQYYLRSGYPGADINAWVFESIGTILKFTFIITGFLCYKFHPRYPYH